MKIGKEIGLLAKKHGVCDEWMKQMFRQSEFKPLCEMYFRGSDWSMEKDFPNRELLKKIKGGVAPHGLLYDFTGKLQNQRYAALFGNSNAEIEISGYSVSELIVRHDSKAVILAKDNSYTSICILDHAKIEIKAENKAKVDVYLYGVDAQVKFSGNVVVKEASFVK